MKALKVVLLFLVLAAYGLSGAAMAANYEFAVAFQNNSSKTVYLCFENRTSTGPQVTMNGQIQYKLAIKSNDAVSLTIEPPSKINAKTEMKFNILLTDKDSCFGTFYTTLSFRGNPTKLVWYGTKGSLTDISTSPLEGTLSTTKTTTFTLTDS